MARTETARWTGCQDSYGPKILTWWVFRRKRVPRDTERRGVGGRVYRRRQYTYDSGARTFPRTLRCPSPRPVARRPPFNPREPAAALPSEGRRDSTCHGRDRSTGHVTADRGCAERVPDLAAQGLAVGLRRVHRSHPRTFALSLGPCDAARHMSLLPNSTGGLEGGPHLAHTLQEYVNMVRVEQLHSLLSLGLVPGHLGRCRLGFG